MTLITQIPRDDPVVQQEYEVPLWSTLVFSLHCPEEPASTVVPILETVCLGKEVLSIEVLLLLWECVPASIVETADVLKLTMWRMIWHIVTIHQVLLAFRHGQGELTSEGGFIGILNVFTVATGHIIVNLQRVKLYNYLLCIQPTWYISLPGRVATPHQSNPNDW